jgi:hypothetical protein
MDRTAWNERYSASELVWGSEPNRFVAAELGAVGLVVDRCDHVERPVATDDSERVAIDVLARAHKP